MPKETKVVTIQDVVLSAPFVGFALQLARDLKSGDGEIHYAVLKDYLSHAVGWDADEGPWWMRTSAAYDVTIEALCEALDGNPNSVGLAATGTNIAEREVP